MSGATTRGPRGASARREHEQACRRAGVQAYRLAARGMRDQGARNVECGWKGGRNVTTTTRYSNLPTLQALARKAKGREDARVMVELHTKPHHLYAHSTFSHSISHFLELHSTPSLSPFLFFVLREQHIPLEYQLLTFIAHTSKNSRESPLQFPSPQHAQSPLRSSSPFTISHLRPRRVSPLRRVQRKCVPSTQLSPSDIVGDASEMKHPQGSHPDVIGYLHCTFPSAKGIISLYLVPCTTASFQSLSLEGRA